MIKDVIIDDFGEYRHRSAQRCGNSLRECGLAEFRISATNRVSKVPTGERSSAPRGAAAARCHAVRQCQCGLASRSVSADRREIEEPVDQRGSTISSAPQPRHRDADHDDRGIEQNCGQPCRAALPKRRSGSATHRTFRQLALKRWSTTRL